MQILSLQEYRDLLDGCERPAQAQIDSFIEFVCGAHSWYKHLPLVPPGVNFYFYLDPNAGQELVFDKDGTMRLRDRLDTDRIKFHYTWMTTATYRSRFGFLSYSARAGTYFMTRGKSGSWAVHRHDSAVVHDSELVPCLVPDELANSAFAELTGAIHEEMSQWNKARKWVEALSGNLDRWPSESGGEGAALELMNLSQELSDEIHRLYGEGRGREARNDPIERQRRREFRERSNRRLAEALKPERNRQKSLMRKAIRSMLELVG